MEPHGKVTFLDLDYTDGLSVPDKNVTKINLSLEVSTVQGTRIGLKINIRQTKSFRLEINESAEVMLGNSKIDQVGSFAYLSSIIGKEIRCSDDVKSR